MAQCNTMPRETRVEIRHNIVNSITRGGFPPLRACGVVASCMGPLNLLSQQLISFIQGPSFLNQNAMRHERRERS